jgi:hypothetical protein
MKAEEREVAGVPAIRIRKCNEAAVQPVFGGIQCMSAENAPRKVLAKESLSR